MLMCMCMLNRRVHILFDKDLWNKLNKVCKAKKISAGEFIRGAVREQLEKNKELPGKERSLSSFKGFFQPGRNKLKT